MFEFMYAKKVNKDSVMEIIEKCRDDYYLFITHNRTEILKYLLVVRKKKARNKMIDCRYCANMDDCQYIVAPEDCEDFEETFEHHWEMMDDIERVEYNLYDAESEK